MALDGVREVDVTLAEMTAEERGRVAPGEPQSGQAEHLNQIRHVIAVMSGKGGVGKSLVSGLLAVALRRQQHTVGVLDADITGPSIPKMLLPDDARPGNSPVAMLPAETETGKQHEIFGPSHAEQVALQLGTPFLGRLPIDPEIATLCDAGRIASYPAEAFAAIAQDLQKSAPAARPPAVPIP